MPGRKRGKNDSQDLATQLSESLESEETSEMTSTEQEPEVRTDSNEEISLVIGVEPPKRTRNGAGRKRDPNPFDEFVEQLYTSGEWGAIEFSDEEDKNKRRNQVKNAVKAHNEANETSYGVEFGVSKSEPNKLKFHVKDKVEGRGRKPGSKKIAGHFYRPEDLDADGNPTPEARAAKEASAAENQVVNS